MENGLRFGFFDDACDVVLVANVGMYKAEIALAALTFLILGRPKAGEIVKDDDFVTTAQSFNR